MESSTTARWPDTAAVRSVRLARERADLNAFVTVVDPPAPPSDGPLHGLPFAAKDVIDTAGVLTTYGSRHFADHVPTEDADCVELLTAAGAVLVGKTTTHEFANGPIGDSSLNGAARNPYDLDRITGGSSAGSAAAVAAGIVPLALATDTGGSARIPASLCGVIGFKPTFGRLSTRGTFPLAPSFDTVGLVTDDPGLLGRVWDLADGTSHAGIGTRVGLLTGEGIAAVDPDVDAAVRRYLAPLDPVELSLPALGGTWEIYRQMQGAEACAIHRERLATTPDLFQPDVRDRLEAGEAVRGWEYVTALQDRRRLQADLPAVFDDVDVLALPTTPITAPLLGTAAVELGGRRVTVREALLSLTHPWSVLGWPAVTVPAGTVAGLPVGAQFVAAPGHDAALIDFIRRVPTPTSHQPQPQRKHHD